MKYNELSELINLLDSLIIPRMIMVIIIFNLWLLVVDVVVTVAQCYNDSTQFIVKRNIFIFIVAQ